MSESAIDIRPVAGALGAEIFGVDLGTSLSNSQFDAIHQAFLDHLVIFFRDQAITPEQHVAFGRRFGDLDIHPFVAGLDDHPEIIPVLKDVDDRGGNFGGTWHSDVTFQEKPALGSILYGIDVPDYGGDTLFANQYLAYETLSDGLKEMLGGLAAVHSARRPYGVESSAIRRYADSNQVSMRIRTGEDANAEMVHPVVRTHPETGRKALFVNHVFTLRFDGWTEAESQPLLDYLHAHATRPEFTCRFRWAKGSIAFWDNRCVQHNALNDYEGKRRYMHRVTVCGDRPV